MDFHSPLETVAMSCQSLGWGLKIIALIQMSTYYYLSFVDSQSQLDQDLREAGPSRTFSLAAVRPLSRGKESLKIIDVVHMEWIFILP